jgi:outer membrane protein assembly factor BamA
LISSGQFRDVQVRPPVNRPGVLLILVEEEARVRRVVFDGLESVQPRTVRDTTNLEAGLPLNRQRILDAKDFIRS